METLDDFLKGRPPTSARPLLGVTVLLVEDSRFAAEGFRLLCLRSGARIRRADSLFHARRHLRVYRPTVVIVDMTLPDGSGADLIADLSAAVPRVDAIIAVSGDPDMEAVATAAGADGFMLKPVERIAVFQSAVLSLLPTDRQPVGPRVISDDLIAPDQIAYRDDLSHVAEVLSGEEDGAAIDYLTQFLGGVARSAHDVSLSDAVDALAARHGEGAPVRAEFARLAALVQNRLTETSPM
ncbi:response regulator [Flavimaricola marinus]|uniref:response regulator n=1 Tax=Flavimaricola marinus TaxID=1819565 RepID=UPI000B8A6CAA